MKIVDLNLLLYAYNSAASEHIPAAAWLKAALLSREIVGLAWVTVLGFLRIATDPKILVSPKDLPGAAGIVSDWLSRDNVSLVSPTDRHWTLLNGLLPRHRARGSLITDAHLAALAIEHGAILCTNDRDFLRFPGLKVEFPLQ